MSKDPIVPNHPDRRFRIKVCGVRRPQDLVACAEAGVDAIGWNLYPPSVRFVDADSQAVRAMGRQAAELGLYQVGVFVNETSDAICRAAEHLGLDAVQLHGDESPELAYSLASRGYCVVRAVRLPGGELEVEQIQTVIGDWAEAPVDLLLDADPGTGFGGGGRRLDWDSIAQWAKRQASGPERTSGPEQTGPEETSGGDLRGWILAGGLSPENVAEAIGRSGALAVDVASGVEQPRGVKSSERIAAFAHACRLAFEKPTPGR